MDESPDHSSRRAFLAGVGGASLSMVGSGGARGASETPEQAAWTDWPMPRHDTANSGVAPTETAGGGRVAFGWRAREGYFGGRFEEGPTSPVVADGTVYARSYLGLRAHDAESGRQQWFYDATIRAGPVVREGDVFVCGDGQLQAVTPGGEQRWVQAVDESTTDIVPTDDGILYTGTEATGVVGYDGERAWELDGGIDSRRIAVRGSRAYVAGRGELVVLDLRSGTVANRRSVGADLDRITVAGSRLIGVAGSDRVLAVPLDDPEVSPTELYASSAFTGSFAAVDGSGLLVAEKRNGVTRLRSVGTAGGSGATVPIEHDGTGDPRAVLATRSHAYVVHGGTVTVVDIDEMTVTATIRTAARSSRLSMPAIATRDPEGGQRRTSVFVTTNEHLLSFTHTGSGRQTVYTHPSVTAFDREIPVGSSLPDIAGLGVGVGTFGLLAGIARQSAGRVRDRSLLEAPESALPTSDSGPVPNVGDIGIRSLGYFLVFSWAVISGLVLFATTIRLDPTVLVPYGLLFDAGGSLLLWRFVTSLTTVLALANGVVGAVVVCRTFGRAERTQVVAAGVSLLVGAGMILLVGTTRLHLAVGYQYGQAIPSILVALPVFVVVTAAVLNDRFGTGEAGYAWFPLALLAPVYLPIHAIAMPWLTADMFAPVSLVLGGHALALVVALAGTLLIVAGVVRGAPFRELAGVNGATAGETDDREPDEADGKPDEADGKPDEADGEPDDEDGDRPGDDGTDREGESTGEDSKEADAGTTTTVSETDSPAGSAGATTGRRDEAFGGAAPGVEYTARRSDSEDAFDRYRGELTGVEGPVEVLTLPETASGPVADAFGNRARIWRSLGGQENLVEVLRVDDDPRPWLAHEPLDDLDSFSTVVHGMDVEDVVSVVDGIAEALRVATLYNHNHHDLRPECVHLDLEAGTCKVSDWGLVRSLQKAQGTERVTRFTAPEQLRSGETTDLQTDIYAVGALAYFGATGTRPYVGTSPMDSAIPTTPFAEANDMTQVPDPLRDPIEQATALNPDDRFGTVASLQGGFRNIL